MTENDWFYEPVTSELRLGDIVTGYTCVTPHLSPETKEETTHIGNLSSIEVVREAYAVVLTPCCSIEGDVLVVSPLERVKPYWFSNPYVSDDFERIDGPMTSEQAIPPAEWEKMDVSERASRLTAPPGLAFLEYFAFPSGGLLPQYSVTYWKKEYATDHYVVDFRRPMLVHHSLPQSEGRHACGDKVLQLSPQARDLLRKKIACYYSRQPAEDSTLDGTAGTVVVAQRF